MNVNNENVATAPAPMRMFESKYLRPVFSPDEDAAAAAAAAAAKIVADAAAAKVIADAAKAAADAEAEAARIAAEKAKTSGMTDEAAKLLKENMKAKKDLEDAKARLKLFDGLDPEAMRKLIADKTAAELKEAEAKGDFERVRKMMADEHAAALKKVADERDAERTDKTSLSSRIVELTIGQAFANSEFVTKQTVLPSSKARAIYGANFEIEGEQIVGYDKPKGATERTKLVDGSGKPLAFEAALKKIVELDPDQNSILRSKLERGAGSNQNQDVRGKEGDPTTELKGAARIEAILAARAAKK